MKIFTPFLLCLLLLACSGGSNENAPAATDSDTAVFTDSATLGSSVDIDSAAVSVDADAGESVTDDNEAKPVDATLGFSYYPVIPQNETRDLRVFVKVQGKPSEVRQSIRQIEKEDLEFTKINDSSVVCIIKNIEAYKKLSIKPLYDFDDFKITKVDDAEPLSQADPNEQTLDLENGNYWHWKVKAIAKTAHLGNITLLIRAETPEGQKLKLAERQINIKIDINEPQLTFGQKIYRFADSHFKEILSLIVIPLVIYLFNIIRKRVKGGQTNQDNKN
jgi:hypothetical protein